MEKRMEGSYIEDLANHGGPESCVGVPRGRSEALTGVHAGRLLSLEMNIWGADAVPNVGRQHRWRRFRELSSGPAGSENLRMRAISPCSRTGRSRDHPCSLLMPRPRWIAGWRIGGWRVARGRPRP